MTEILLLEEQLKLVILSPGCTLKSTGPLLQSIQAQVPPKTNYDQNLWEGVGRGSHQYLIKAHQVC